MFIEVYSGSQTIGSGGRMKRQTNDPVHGADDQAAANLLNELLVGWHRWARAHTLVYSYPSTDAACRLYRASRQYDDGNGSLDAQAEVSMMEAVDSIIDQIEQPMRTALSIQARNLCTGVSVWSSPRLPECHMQRAAILVKARNIFSARLAKAELI